MMWTVQVPVVPILKYAGSRLICKDSTTYAVEATYIIMIWVISHSVNRVAWRDIYRYIRENFHVLVSHLVSRVIWSCISAPILGSDHAAGINVIDHSGTRVIWRYINACILESNHTPVKCVINHSGIRFTWAYINTHVLESDHTSVICVLSRSQRWVLWSTPVPIYWVVAATHLWCLY